MYLTGYHGTSKQNAENIINQNMFLVSNGSKEWLGRGIYFYPNFADALQWSTKEYQDGGVVIHALIKVRENEIIDLDTDSGKKLINDMMDIIDESLNLSKNKVQENQCKLCNAIWDINKNIKVIRSSFAKEPRTFQFLVDYREQRKEFAVRNNSCIDGVFIVPLAIKTSNSSRSDKEEVR